MILPIVIHPNDLLRVHTEDLSLEMIQDADTQALIANMIETMYSANGIGIAAPQIGKLLRICIIGKEADKSLKEDLVLINPSWKRTSKKKTKDQEGCLSIPRVYGDVVRWKHISVTALDQNGAPLTFDAQGFFARVIQHEVDHLNGVLFIDSATGIHELDPLKV